LLHKQLFVPLNWC